MITKSNCLKLAQLKSRSFVSRINYKDGLWFGSGAGTYFFASSLPKAIEYAREIAARKISNYLEHNEDVYPEGLLEYFAKRKK